MVDERAGIVFFRIPLCGKCKQVVAKLAQVKKDRPALKVRIYTLPDHLGLARRHDLLTIPALLINGTPYRGVLSTHRYSPPSTPRPNLDRRSITILYTPAQLLGKQPRGYT